MADQLANLRVLVTRPAHQAAALLQQLQALGASPVPCPLLEICPVSEADPDYHPLKQQIMDLDLYQHVIFISPNAARIGCDWIDQYWPQLPVGIQWLAIGRQSAEQLLNYGIAAYHSPLGYDSEALLASPALQQVAGERILIMRGQGGREKLASTLRARGAEVSYAELYRRQCPDYSAAELKQCLFSQPLDVILISSGEGLSNLLRITATTPELSRDSLFNCHLVVPSERVQQDAKEAGFKRVTTASGPDDASMISALMP
ncbi:uroporphyrinogen-III synthase [Neptuniibacter halophilus]|uniref:uroporphyrinogen-III synthase n=1 Tax=Neptuniibacter halophilus TaxID=651666 RepID=UPI002574714F|nr:uroporphyrinogen-III synthase [Neptuniibacter halophilus]